MCSQETNSLVKDGTFEKVFFKTENFHIFYKIPLLRKCLLYEEDIGKTFESLI